VSNYGELTILIVEVHWQLVEVMVLLKCGVVGRAPLCHHSKVKVLFGCLLTLGGLRK
jgi:hypothetical protein